MTKTTRQEKCKHGTFGGAPKIDATPEEIAKVAIFGGDGAVRERRKAQERKEKRNE